MNLWATSHNYLFFLFSQQKQLKPPVQQESQKRLNFAVQALELSAGPQTTHSVFTTASPGLRCLRLPFPLQLLPLLCSPTGLFGKSLQNIFLLCLTGFSHQIPQVVARGRRSVSLSSTVLYGIRSLLVHSPIDRHVGCPTS